MPNKNQDMMTSTEVVETAMVETYRVTLSFEEKVNMFLDSLLQVKVNYEEVNDRWRQVNDLTEKYISSCQSKTDLTTLCLQIEGLITVGERVFKKLSESHLRKMLPSILGDIEENLDHIKELHADIKIKISDLPGLISAEEKLLKLGF